MEEEEVMWIMNIGRSYIDFKRNKFVIPVIDRVTTISIPWGEEESSEELEKKLIADGDLSDYLLDHFLPSTEEAYDLIKDTWPWSIKVYVYNSYYIIAEFGLTDACPSMMPSCVAISANKFSLMNFIKDIVLPFLEAK